MFYHSYYCVTRVIIDYASMIRVVLIRCGITLLVIIRNKSCSCLVMTFITRIIRSRSNVVGRLIHRMSIIRRCVPSLLRIPNISPVPLIRLLLRCVIGIPLVCRTLRL